MVAYRAEFLVWILTTNMPLVMMALWNAVAADGPVGRFGQRDFNAYYLGVLVVRILTSTWLVWELTMDIRGGRWRRACCGPLHPLLAYSAQHLAAVPMRALVVSPLVVILLVMMGGRAAACWRPWRLAVFLASAGGGLAAAVLDHGQHRLAGHVRGQRPVDLRAVAGGALRAVGLPGAGRAAAGLGGAGQPALPFFYMLGFPVETAVGLLDRGAALQALAMQWAYVALMLVAGLTIWRLGMKRFVAFGG